MPNIEDVFEKIIVAVAPGFAFVAIGQPFDLIRLRLAAATAGVPAYAGAIDCATTTFRREGLLVFWKGAVPALLLNVPASGLFYGTYKHFQPPSPAPGAATADWYAQVFGAGVIAGLPSCTFSNPLEVWRVRAQTEVKAKLTGHSSSSGSSSSGGIRSDAPTVFQKLQAGPKHIFMRGFSLTMFRNVPGSGLYFFSYESAMHAMESRGLLRSHQDRALWAGGMVGFGFNLIFHPFEVVRVNVMNTDTGTVRAAVQELVAKGGYKYLYRGLLTTTARAILLNASGLWVLESVQALVNSRRSSYCDKTSTRNHGDSSRAPAAFERRFSLSWVP